MNSSKTVSIMKKLATLALSFLALLPAAAQDDTKGTIEPQGTPQWYIMDSYVETGRGTEMVHGFVGHVSKSDDGKSVYFSTLFPTSYETLWVRGTVEGSTVTIDHNEVVGVYSETDGRQIYNYDLKVGEPVFDAYENIVGMRDVVFKTDGSHYYIDDDLQAPDHPMMLYAEEEGYGYLPFDWTFCNDLYPYTKSLDLVTLPEGAEQKTYTYTYKDNSGKECTTVGHVATVGNDYYFDMLTDLDTHPWVKGTRTGNTITLEKGQLITRDVQYQFFAGLDGSTMRTQPFTLTINEATGELTRGDVAENQSFAIAYVFNAAQNASHLTSAAYNFKLIPFKDGGDIELRNPEDVECGYYSEIGQHYITFYQTPVAANGTQLNPDNYGYYIYVDGERFTFTHAQYPYLKWESTEFIPYNYNDADDPNYCDIYYDTRTTVLFYFKDYKTLGVQSVYRLNDGSELHSDIVTVDKLNNVTILPDAISQISVTPAQSDTWYDLYGRRTNTANGIVVTNGRKILMK